MDPQGSHGSIPNYRPGPILSPGRRAALLTLVALPALGYGILKLRTKSIVQEARQLEEEGRKNFTLVQDRESKDKDLSVNVGRSGGGV